MRVVLYHVQAGHARRSIAGASHWPPASAVLSVTFSDSTATGLALRPDPYPYCQSSFTGVLFLCALPSRVPVINRFTSLGAGTFGGRLVTAWSSLVGFIFFPMDADPGRRFFAEYRGGWLPAGCDGQIASELLVPFIGGHFRRRWIGAWVDRKGWLKGIVKTRVRFLWLGLYRLRLWSAR